MIVRSGALGTLVLAACIIGSGALTSYTQFTITIPGIPKIKKEKPTPTPTPASEDAPAPATPVTPGSTISSTSTEPEPQAKKTCEDNIVYSVYKEDIEKTRKQAEEYRPGLRDYYVEDFNDNENKYLKGAIGDRKDFFGDDPDPEWVKCITPLLDQLAAAAEKTIGSYRPTGYTFGTPAEKNILKAGVTDLAKATVYNVGLNSATWKIIKNDLGIPERRKRFGTIWAKYPWNKYCTIIYINLIQDYAGGGTYNASEYQFVSWEFAGCPAK